MDQALADPHPDDREHQVPGQRPGDFLCLRGAAAAQVLSRGVADEAAVAIEINGFGYAVMMATPVELDDLLYGFLRAERLVAEPRDIVSFDVCRLDAGYIVRATIARAADTLADRVRHRTSDSGCGLCGVENLDQAMRDLPRVTTRSTADGAAIFRALDDLAGHQPLNRATGAVHAAALCASDGAIRLVREDVGRHNAFDKLIGAMMRRGLAWDAGFALLSSRCSYELVEKAVLSDCPRLVTISAPTALAIRRAQDAGLDLRVLARRDSMLSPLASG